MKKLLSRVNKKEAVFIFVFVALLIALGVMPTGFEKQIYLNSEGVKAKVITVDDSGVYSTGLIKQGGQVCWVRLESGSHKGEEVAATNLYTGKLEFDKTFAVGDTAWLLLERDENNNVIFANMIDHYRFDLMLVLIGLFALCLIVFSGFTGIRTLLSFAFALLAIWKVLIPSMLRGSDPMLIALIVGNVITIATLLLVAGFSKKALAAIAGAVTCSFITCLLSMLWGDVFRVHGAVMQWSESLLYSGFANLDLTAIFQAGIYLACSGAILDLAIDISAALDEVSVHNPGVSRRALVKSGLTIGKSVVGSQTTTLLLAYMGSYISVMMVFMAQGTPMMNIFNTKMIAAEVLHTFVGCIGLVMVSPLTSVICGFVYKRNPGKTAQAEDAGLSGEPAAVVQPDADAL